MPVIGTAACVLVSALFHLGAAHLQGVATSMLGSGVVGASKLARTCRRGGTRGKRVSAVVQVGGKAEAAPAGPGDAPVIVVEQAPFPAARRRVAIQAGVSIAILAAGAYALNLPGFVQAIVTVIAVVALPATLIATDATRSVLEKIVQRIAGCLLAGIVALVLLPLLRGDPIACMIALMLGVLVGCHLQTGQQGASYIGRQFAIAFIMVFVQDHQWSADPQPALLRLGGILIGVVVIAGVMQA